MRRRLVASPGGACARDGRLLRDARRSMARLPGRSRDNPGTDLGLRPGTDQARREQGASATRRAWCRTECAANHLDQRRQRGTRLHRVLRGHGRGQVADHRLVGGARRRELRLRLAPQYPRASAGGSARARARHFPTSDYAEARPPRDRSRGHRDGRDPGPPGRRGRRPADRLASCPLSANVV